MGDAGRSIRGGYGAVTGVGPYFLNANDDPSEIDSMGLTRW